MTPTSLHCGRRSVSFVTWPRISLLWQKVRFIRDLAMDIVVDSDRIKANFSHRAISHESCFDRYSCDLSQPFPINVVDVLLRR